MGEPFLSEIKIMSFGFAPRGWAQCNGQVLPINQNQALFACITNTYGGDGRTTFALPDLRSRAAMSIVSGQGLGVKGGEAAHTLTIPELPSHPHTFNGTTNGGNVAAPQNNLFGTLANLYTGAANLTPLVPASISTVGGSQPHDNMQPYLTLNFCIALQGVFPSPN